MKILLSVLIASTSIAFASFHNDAAGHNAISNASISDVAVSQLFENILEHEKATVLNNHYSTLYFSNLNEHFANNSHGTCSFVSIGMLLSFYDSYWNDNIISENFDVQSNFSSTSPISQDFEFPPFGITSPGIGFEENSIVSGMTIADYRSFVLQNENTYFQSKLLILAESYFGSSRFDTSINPYGMTFQEINDFLEYYLFTFKSFTSQDFTISSSNGYPNDVMSFTVSNILSGKPVLIRANSSIFGGHAMIAYDYDSNTGELFVHPGWKDNNNNALTHVSLNQLGISQIEDAIVINTSSSHTHSNNYHSSHGNNLCSCLYSFPQNIVIESGNYRDMNPTFVWKSLYNENWFSSYSPFFKFSILDSNHISLFTKNCINGCCCTLSSEEWDYVLYNAAGNSYYAYVELSSNSYPYWDDYYSLKLFNKPKDYNVLPHIKPNEYGFADAYPDDIYTKTTYVEHQTSNGFKFKTRRYRTGYIHNEYIVMSPKRLGYTEAFIEYKFTKAISRIDVALSHWRSTSLEGLTSSTGNAVVQQFWGNQYITNLDLLSSTTNLPENRNSQIIYKICFSQPVYIIRFYSNTFSQNTNDNNRGRICIGDIAFYEDEQSMPLSGYELEYSPNDWNYNPVLGGTNCYAYAINNQVWPGTNNLTFLQPGQYSGNTITECTSEVLVNAVSNDFATYTIYKQSTYEFLPVGKYDRCPVGTYKVALACYRTGWWIFTSQDYHWYRQNPDGSWSHKQGATQVKLTDNSGNIIRDPETCDRGDYNVFVGFFAVRPWGNLYV